MSLSLSITKDHERAHELVVQWRKSGYASGGPSDNGRMFKYAIHLEDEIENLTKKLQTNNADLGSSSPNRPVVVGTPPPAAHKPSASLLAMAQELEETQAALDLAQGEIAHLKLELANVAAAAPVVSNDTRVVELETMLTNGHTLVEQLLETLTVVPKVSRVAAVEPTGMPTAPSTLKAQHQELAPPLPPKPVPAKAEAPKAPKLTVVPEKAKPEVTEASDEALTRINNTVKAWKKGIVVAKTTNGYVFSQKGDTFLTITRMGSGGIWSSSGNVQNGLAKRVVVALRDELGYKI